MPYLANLPVERLIEAVIAAGIGLFVGLEREHSDQPDTSAAYGGGEGKRRGHHIGVRSFALIALLGWVAAILSSRAPWLGVAAFLSVTALISLEYLRSAERVPGITTEIAALVMFGAGALVAEEPLLAVALSLGVTLLLFSKPWVRSVVAGMRRFELLAALQLLILVAIVLPLLPDAAPDPWGVLSPRRIAIFVVLIAGMSFIGYVLTRLLGPSRGAGVTGLAGGIASSTAVTATMAQRVRHGEPVAPAQMAVLLANAILFARIAAVAAFINTRLAAALALPFTAMGAVMLGAAVWSWRRMHNAPPVATETGAGLQLKNPFALLPALKWGLIFSIVLVVAAVARDELGERGALIAAAASGLADVDAITLAVARQAVDGELSLRTAALAVVIAILANNLVKGAIAVITGGRRFGLPILVAFAACMAAGLLSVLTM